jgi:hypothetical protein
VTLSQAKQQQQQQPKGTKIKDDQVKINVIPMYLKYHVNI